MLAGNTNKQIKTLVFSLVATCSIWLYGNNSEEHTASFFMTEGCMSLQTIGIQPKYYMAQQPTRLPFTFTLS
jgi:hypothetical protein